MATINAINTAYPIGVASGGTGANTLTANSLILANGTGAFTALGAATNGQIPIGYTSNAPVLATITAGTGITVTNGTGTISIAATAVSALTWTNVTGSTQAMAVNTGYIANDSSSLVTMTLPSTATVGQIVAVVGSSADGWQIAQNASQTIQFQGLVSTSGTGGYIASTTAFDCVELMCIVTNNGWVVRTAVGNITVH